MNKMPEKSVTDRKKLMLPQEISEVFSQLGLQKEEEREKFRSLAEVKQPEMKVSAFCCPAPPPD